MSKLRTTLFLSPDVLDALGRHARTRRLGSPSQAADQLLRQALFCHTEEYVEERVLPSIRAAIREELADRDARPRPATPLGTARGRCER